MPISTRRPSLSDWEPVMSGCYLPQLSAVTDKVADNNPVYQMASGDHITQGGQADYNPGL